MTINKMRNKLLTIVTELPVHDDEAAGIVSEENKKQNVDSTTMCKSNMLFMLLNSLVDLFVSLWLQHKKQQFVTFVLDPDLLKIVGIWGAIQAGDKSVQSEGSLFPKHMATCMLVDT